jgi:ABC-2 type transport system ATP-binding protein
MPQDRTILAAEGVSKTFGSVQAVRDLSITLNRGDIVGLVGRNGAGKSTLLGMLLDVVRPTSGRVRLLAGLSRKDIAGTVNRPGFMPAISVRRALGAWAGLTGATTRRRSALVEVLGIDRILSRRVATLSLGESQRLALAVTLLRDPDVLILDEPGNGLDPEGAREVRRFLRARADSGKAVLVSSHQLTELEQVCTHFVLMNGGRAEVTGTRDVIVSGEAGVVITCGEPRRFAEALDAFPGATVTVEDGEVHVLGDMDGSDILQHLARHGLFPSELRRRKRTLSDVYFEVT